MNYSFPKILALSILFVYSLNSFAQKEAKPQVFVYGSSIASFAVAMQCAQSDVAVVWAFDGNEFVSELNKDSFSIANAENLDGGIFMDLLMQVANHDLPNDSVAQVVKRNITTRIFNNAIESLLAKQPKLKVLKNQQLKQIAFSKKDWNVALSDKSKFSVSAVFDGSPQQELANFLKLADSDSAVAMKPIAQFSANELRTLIASGESEGEIYGINLPSLLSIQRDGFYALTKIQGLGNSTNEMPFHANIGQAIGATMAYTAFFKTTTDKIDVRKLQSELLKFNARIVPYKDIEIQDSNFQKIQRFGLSGILMGKQLGNRYVLDCLDSVKIAEVKAPILRFSSRSQLWFKNQDADFFELSEFQDFLKIISFRDASAGAIRDREFESFFERHVNHSASPKVSRYLFATAIETFCKLFDVKISQSGIILR
ncbi:hypothetical protein [Sphingobacterium hungaricum]